MILTMRRLMVVTGFWMLAIGLSWVGAVRV